MFWLVIAVDVVCGPLLTLVLWNPGKPRRELLLDLALVAAVQLAAIAYGTYTVAMARPVHMVFEVDRLRIVTAAEIDPADLAQAPPHLRQLPWTGPTLLSVRAPRDGAEFLKSLDLSMAGQDPSLRPSWWQPYALDLPQLLQRAQPLAVLAKARPYQSNLLEEAIRQAEAPASELL